jgi:hypothetical protein
MALLLKFLEQVYFMDTQSSSAPPSAASRHSRFAAFKDQREINAIRMMMGIGTPSRYKRIERPMMVSSQL